MKRTLGHAREDRNADRLLDLTTANIYLDLGDLSKAKRWLEEAKAAFYKAMQISPESPGYRDNYEKAEL